MSSLCEQAAQAPTDRRIWFGREAVFDTTTGVGFSALHRCAQLYGGALQQSGLRRAERVALLISAPEHGLPLLLGAMQAALVPVLVPLPLTAQALPAFAQRLSPLLAQHGVQTVVASRARCERLASAAPDLAETLRFLPIETLSSSQQLVTVDSLTDSDCALIQIASDGPAESGAELLRQSDLFDRVGESARRLSVSEQDVFVSWLPPSEFAGVMSWLLPLYCRCSAALFPFADFVRQPSTWLHVLTRARGTISFATPDAYAFCAQRSTPAQLAGVDLTRWRVAGAAHEPIGGELRSTFQTALAGAKFSAAAFDAAGSDAWLPQDEAETAASHGQKALWFLAELAPDSTAYNVPVCFRISSALDQSALERTLEQIVRRHAALRTVFAERDGVLYRRLQEQVTGWFEAVDATHFREGELAQHLTAALERRFELSTGPLFVARVFTRGPGEAYLLLVAHHIVLDALSFLHIAAELVTLYPQFAAGRPPAPPAVDRSYDAWVRRQRALLTGPDGERLRQYWATRLSAAAPALDLPSDRPRPSLQSQRGAVRQLRLSAALCAELRSLAERERTTLFTVALAGFYALLHRLTGQRDLVVATQVAGRSSEAQSAVGYFVNTLPLRARIDDDSSTYLHLVRQLRRSVAEALDHQDLPFALIVEQSKLVRDPSRAPLSQLMFQLQAHRAPHDFAPTLQALSAGQGARIGALEIEQFPLEQRSAQCDLRIDLRDFGGEVAGILEYNTDLFDAERIARFSDAYLDLLRQYADDPNALIAIPAASAASPAQPLAAWNQTTVDYPDGRVQYAFERCAAEHPASIALLFGSDSLDYGELNRRANRLARWLREHGAQRDVLVGVCMERSLELAVALLAILKAGAAYVPLDPSYPSARLSYMLQDAAPLLVIADDIELGPLADAAQRRAGVWLARAALRDITLDQRVPAHDLDHGCAAGDLAYLIYTSGSTGAPKGVANTHAGLWNRLCWMQEAYQLARHDCVLQKTPYSFDVSVWEFFWPLMVGARLAIARPEGHKDPGYLLEEIARQQVTTIHFVPSMLVAFLAEPQLGPASSLTRVICSGEALPYASMLSCLQRLPHAALHNLYGPTEASIDVTAWRCAPHPRGIVPIGRPIANTQIHLLDEARRPVPVGESGELYIAGVGLARGYHNRPELTAQRFVPNPFSDDPKARMYKTGDLARFDADGVIEYLGRNDDQIKLRGFRVELGEIEAVAAQHPGVRQCVVVARRLGEAVRLEAFVVAAADAFDAHALERWLAGRLPDYMVPRRFECVAALPLTPSGKTDRSALLALACTPTAPARVAPRSDTERALVAVWQRVLGLAEEPSIHDNYFELGGDSIRSLQVRALAREHGLLLSVQALLAHQTIAELAQQLAAPVLLAAETRLAPFALISPAQRGLLADYEDAFPVTQLQLGMLFHSQLTADSWAYLDCLSFEFGLARQWRADALQRAIERSMRRHPMLRACFEMAAYDRPLTLIARQARVPLVVHDLRGVGEQRAREALREYIAADKTLGYALDSAPLFRVAAHVLEDRRVRITLSFHHAILDGWSAASLMRELLSEYLTDGYDAGQAPQFTEAGFGEFVALEAEALASESSRDHFRRSLEGSELVELPRWPGAQLASRPGSARLIVPIDSELRSRLSALAAQLRAPLKALLLAGHLRTLAAFTGTDQVITGCVTHGRPELSGAERVLGMFLNTLPVRASLANKSWAQLIAQLLEHERAQHPHRRYPLQEILRQLGHKALFTTAFNFVNFHVYGQLFAGAELSLLDFEVHENTSFGLLANFVQSPLDDGLALHLEYDAQRIAREQAERIALGHVLALRALAADVHAAVQDARVITADEQARIDAFQGAEAGLAACAVHDLVQPAVARTPEGIAVQYGDAQLSYAELDVWANALAGRLSAAQLQPGEAVGICAEPSLERAVAVLATLRSGCAYLPLDPAFPVERLQYMLEHAGVRHVLVTPAHAAAEFLAGTQRQLIERGALCADPVRAVGASDAAYVIYTSGSTGRPKGIVMPHGVLSNLVSWQCARSALPAGTTTAQFSAFSFDVSFQELFSTWAASGRLLMVPEHARKDVRELSRLLVAEQVARLFIPVVVLHQLADVAEQLELTFPALREIITAGEQLEISPGVRAFFRRHPGCRLDNQYGPSETHVATAQLMAAGPESWPALPAIGRPLPGARAYVLDSAGQPAPLGVPGELYLAGACVALGYIGAPELSAERFLPDRRQVDPSARMYMTGDRARWLPDGSLEYLGRRDGQVKIRGYRVEPAEIEAAIMEIAGDRLKRAVVISVPVRAAAGARTEYELSAYLHCDREIQLDLAELRRALARRLPAPMLPRSFTRLESLPLTPSGKLDRRALPDALRVATDARDKRAPTDALEAELCGMWQEVLARPDIGTSDDFFASGGDSLRAVRLMARVQRRFGVELPLSVLIESPTVRELAEGLRRAGLRAESPLLIALSSPRKQSSARARLFCVHPLGGNVLCYMPLARRLAADAACYALQARGLDGRAAPHSSLVEMASAYAGEILSLQRSGPVHLAGWSFGGLVAVEVARQLQNAGRELAPVFVLDGMAGLGSGAPPSDDDLIACLAMELLGAQFDQQLWAELEAQRGTRDRAQGLQQLLAAARARGVDSELVESTRIQALLDVVQSNVRAAYAYSPAPYDGEVVLLRCTDPLPAQLKAVHDRFGSAYADAQNGWGPFCRRLKVVPVRGDHLNLIAEPHVGAVAELLRSSLQAPEPAALSAAAGA